MADKKHCVPCNSDMAPLNHKEAQAQLKKLKNWQLTDNSTWLEKKFIFPNFVTALKFVNQVAQISEEEGHHPDIYFTWGKCTIRLQTHKISGLHYNDFILAGRIDMI